MTLADRIRAAMEADPEPELTDEQIAQAALILKLRPTASESPAGRRGKR